MPTIMVVTLLGLSFLASGCVSTCKACWIPGYLQDPSRKCVEPWYGVDEGDGCALIVESHVTCPTAADLHVPGEEACAPPDDPGQAFPCAADLACPQEYDRCPSPGFCCPGETR